VTRRSTVSNVTGLTWLLDVRCRGQRLFVGVLRALTRDMFRHIEPHKILQYSYRSAP
jgi:hypothetical protein